MLLIYQRSENKVIKKNLYKLFKKAKIVNLKLVDIIEFQNIEVPIISKI